MGSAVRNVIARRLKVSPRKRLTLIAVGAGAGLAAVVADVIAKVGAHPFAVFSVSK